MPIIHQYLNLIDEKLHILEKSFEVATELSGVGIWNVDFQNNKVTADNKTLMVFSIETGFDFTLDTLLSKLTIDDRIKFRQRITKTKEEKIPFNFLCKIVLAGNYSKEIRCFGRNFKNRYLVGACMLTLPCHLPECHIRQLLGDKADKYFCKAIDFSPDTLS